MAGLAFRNSEVKSETEEAIPSKGDFDPDRRLDMGMPNEGTESRRHFDPNERVRPVDNVDDAEPRIEGAGGGTDAPAMDGVDVQRRDKIEECAAAYVKDLVAHSEVPDTLRDFRIDANELRGITVEERKERAKEYAGCKSDLIRQWEEKHGPWPTYKHDVYNEHGELIRKAAQRYEAHHMIPLELGGANTADNITPLSVEAHRGAGTGIHGSEGPLRQLRAAVKGA